MNTEIIPLGIASAVPTRHRHLSAVALFRQGRMLLFDCGEGTQFQLLKSGLNRTHIDAILITHFHGDHYLGLMGLVSTMAMLNRTDPLCIIGPGGIADMMVALPGLKNKWLTFSIEYVEIEESFTKRIVLDTPEYFVEARPLEHRIFSIGYRFQEKARPGHLNVDIARKLGVTEYTHFRQLKAGKPVGLAGGRVVDPAEVIGPKHPGVSFAYITDTRPCENSVLLARNVDLLYHEATFTSDLIKQAKETGHSTAQEAAQIAGKAGASRLLLGHFSARYKDPMPLIQEAQLTFKNTEAAEELKRYDVRVAPGKGTINKE